MGKARLTIRDNGFKRFIAAGKDLAGRPHVKVGFLQSTASRREVPGEPNDLTNVELAVIVHFGTHDGRIPPRPFLTRALKRARRGWRLMLGRIGAAHMKGTGGVASGLGKLGERAVAQIRTSMRTIGVPDAAATLAEKTGSKALIDSRQLLESVTWEVVLGG